MTEERVHVREISHQEGQGLLADGAPRSELGGHVADSAEPRSTPGGAAAHAAGPAASGTRLVDAWPVGPEIVDAPDDPVVGLLLAATELGVALVGVRGS